ncbi:hypothetical protein BVI2075_1400010 [Burkholderia vietnamiensis]|nr:hypothetical protein BVI2075_1400010 [Burkholderia vietnamiensis]CAG9199550.1 hypothetical protein BVI1335_1430010 [Burkholderia vietnamiensis]
MSEKVALLHYERLLAKLKGLVDTT